MIGRDHSNEEKTSNREHNDETRQNAMSKWSYLYILNPAMLACTILPRWVNRKHDQFNRITQGSTSGHSPRRAGRRCRIATSIAQLQGRCNHAPAGLKPNSAHVESGRTSGKLAYLLEDCGIRDEFRRCERSEGCPCLESDIESLGTVTRAYSALPCGVISSKPVRECGVE
jgi:hypothetical protein